MGELGPGQTLGDFRLEAEIGRGGMGVVYLARQLSLGRSVALKVLPREYLRDPMYVGRFKREAEAISRLDHPHVVPVIAVGEEDGHRFIAMKHVAGATLDALIRARSEGGGAPLASSEPTLVIPREGPPRMVRRSKETPSDFGDGGVLGRLATCEPGTWRVRVAEIGEKIALALGHAHDRGIIHRDVKPGNILVDRDGEPCLLDFGLVRDLCDDRTLCDGRSVLGTAQYMSPEQVRGFRRLTTGRSDVYSLGVTLYEALTMRRPFDDRATTAVLHAVVEEEPPSPRSLVRDLPVDLETIVLKAMSKRPEDRYATASDMAADLRRFRNAEPIAAIRPGFRAWRRQFKKMQSAAIAASFAAFLVSVGVAGVVVMGGDRDAELRATALRDADAAYAQGDFVVAAEHYAVFERLGGRDAEVEDRRRRCRLRLGDATRTVESK
jgi:eukaryotic-like serine/threonine-protein kinase